MGSIHYEARLDVPADVAWDYLDRFARAEVLPFASAAAARREGEYRVVTMPGGFEVRERIVTVDPARRRTSYTIAGLNDAEHHHAEMRLDVAADGAVTLVWVTDYLPHELADQRAAAYAALFDELVAAVNKHGESNPLSRTDPADSPQLDQARTPPRPHSPCALRVAHRRAPARTWSLPVAGCP